MENGLVVNYDISYGGAFYAYVNINQFGITLGTENYNTLIELGKTIKSKVSSSVTIKHPIEADLSFLYGVLPLIHLIDYI